MYYNFFDKRKITFRPFFSKVQLGIRDFWNRGKQAAKLAYHASLLPWISLANEMTTRPPWQNKARTLPLPNDKIMTDCVL